MSSKREAFLLSTPFNKVNKNHSKRDISTEAYIKYLEADYKNHISIDKIEKWIDDILSLDELLKTSSIVIRDKLIKLKSLIAEVRGDRNKSKCKI